MPDHDPKARRKIWYAQIGAYLLLLAATVVGVTVIWHQQTDLDKQHRDLAAEATARRADANRALILNCRRENNSNQILAGLVKVSLTPAASTAKFRARLENDLALLDPNSVVADVIRQLLVATRPGADGSGFRAAFEKALMQLRPIDCTKIRIPPQ